MREELVGEKEDGVQKGRCRENLRRIMVVMLKMKMHKSNQKSNKRPTAKSMTPILAPRSVAIIY